jgi:hypothetical protein
VATMDLLRCVVCGEPLFTMDFSYTLAERLDTNVEHLCPLHRKTQAMDTWKRVSPEKTKPNEAKK